MNEFRKRDTGGIITEREFRNAYENVGFPLVLDQAVFDTYRIDPILATPQPTPEVFQTVQRNGATGDGTGRWFQAWTVVNWTQDQIDTHKAAAKAAKWAAIKAERDRRKAAGVKVVVGGVDKWFHSDDTSRIQQIGLVMMGASIPAGLQWKTMDGTFVTMTQALANQIFGACAMSDQTLFAKAEEHRALMEAATDPATYDIMQGWPATFTG